LNQLGRTSPWSLRRLTVRQRKLLEKTYTETIKKWRESGELNTFPTPTLSEFYYFMLYRSIENLRKLLREDPAAFVWIMREIRRKRE